MDEGVENEEEKIKIKIGKEGEYNNLNLIKKDGKIQGLEVEIEREICEKMKEK